MLTFQYPKPVKHITAFIYSDESNYFRVCQRLCSWYGSLDYESPAIPFTYTDYYIREMGEKLWRRFISFDRLKDADEFREIKIQAVELEKEFAVQDRRTVNIDPGYLNEAKLVLLTTKDFSHRIYLGRGVYAEVTLQYEHNDFKSLPTTFPDYRTREYKTILLVIRDLYRKQLK